MSINIGLALYSIRGELEKDYLGTLEKVAEVGYTHVELVSHSLSEEAKSKITPGAIGNKLKELGLTAVSCHVSAMPGTDWDAVIEENAEMGCKGIVLPFGFLNNREEIGNIAGLCNTVGKKCRQRGMDFYYHNHFQEFVKTDGQYGLDLLMESTDPEYVSFELDTYWALRAGVNPVEELGRLGSRCRLVHQKDLSAGANPVNVFEVMKGEINGDTIMKFFQEGQAVKPTDIVEVGTGVMDIKAICSKAKELGSVQCIIVELDYIYNMGPMDSITVSLNNLKNAIK